MSSNDEAISKSKAEPDLASSSGANADRKAYVGIGVYCALNIAWLVAVFSGDGFGIFDTIALSGIVLPLAGIIILIVFQRSDPRNKFSLLANILSLVAIGGWFYFVWSVFAAASAMV